jgi:hypothetical protein
MCIQVCRTKVKRHGLSLPWSKVAELIKSPSIGQLQSAYACKNHEKTKKLCAPHKEQKIKQHIGMCCIAFSLLVLASVAESLFHAHLLHGVCLWLQGRRLCVITAQQFALVKHL